jgi:hypothetical protein
VNENIIVGRVATFPNTAVGNVPIPLMATKQEQRRQIP